MNSDDQAVKYNRVACEEISSGRVHLAVSDSGMGIAPAMLDRLFTPFDRLGADQTGIEGTGLGLALSQRLVEIMGGRLMVESRVGEGTTFTIELSTAESPPVEIAPEETDSADTEPLTLRGTVLYVEDNVANLRLVERIVSRRPGVTLLSAMQGRRGLELARDHQPDLIVLDLHLPDMPGSAVLGHLRVDPRTRQIPVVILSADATSRSVTRLIAEGARSYLTKPVDVKEFLALLDELLNGSGR